MVAEPPSPVQALSSAEESVEQQSTKYAAATSEEEKKEEEPLPVPEHTPAEPLTAEPVPPHDAPWEENQQANAPAEQAPVPATDEDSQKKKKGGLKAYLATLASRNKAKKEYLAKLKESNEAKKKALAAKQPNKVHADKQSKALIEPIPEEGSVTTDAAVTTEETTTTAAAVVATTTTTTTTASTVDAAKSLAFVEEKADPAPIKPESGTDEEEKESTPKEELESADKAVDEKEQGESAPKEKEEGEENSKSSSKVIETIEIRDSAELAKAETTPEEEIREKIAKVEEAAQAHATWTCCGGW